VGWTMSPDEPEICDSIESVLAASAEKVTALSLEKCETVIEVEAIRGNRSAAS
jgi:hypothetical protein